MEATKVIKAILKIIIKKIKKEVKEVKEDYNKDTIIVMSILFGCGIFIGGISAFNINFVPLGIVFISLSGLLFILPAYELVKLIINVIKKITTGIKKFIHEVKETIEEEE